MLPADRRLRSRTGFRTAVRGGARTGSRTLVVHAAAAPGERTRVGFVVSRAVGNAVSRNRVRRRLRHLARERLPEVPEGLVVVVRALPAAAGATSAELGIDLRRCLERSARLARPGILGSA